MNAPWKPTGVAHREPFAAYVCDETTAETLRPVASELAPQVAADSEREARTHTAPASPVHLRLKRAT